LEDREQSKKITCDLYKGGNIEAGVLYVNRASGATTGAWPGYQSFGG